MHFGYTDMTNMVLNLKQYSLPRIMTFKFWQRLSFLRKILFALIVPLCIEDDF